MGSESQEDCLKGQGVWNSAGNTILSFLLFLLRDLHTKHMVSRSPAGWDLKPSDIWKCYLDLMISQSMKYLKVSGRKE